MNEHFIFKNKLEAAYFMKNKRNWEKFSPGSWAISLLSIVAIILFPSFFIYFQNAGEANFVDIVPISCWFLLGALLLCAILFLIYRNIVKAAALTDFAALLFLNYALIETGMKVISHSIYYWHVAYILLIIIIVLGVVLYKKIATELAKYFNLVMVIIFGALILINAATAAPTIVRKMTSDVKHSDMKAVISENAGKDKPNIYMFLFDEYGGYENLLHYCDYDNSEFYKSLKAQGFNISTSSHNEAISTDIVVPNLLNMDYVNDDSMIADARLENMKNPYIYKLLSANGYSINILDNMSFLDSSNCNYANSTGIPSKEYSVEYYIIQKTAFQPFYVSVVSDETETINSLFKYASFSTSLQESNLFTLGYFNFPHVPWFVDENGQPINSADRENWANPNIYLGQLKYASKKIIEMTKTITEKDPDSIIILMSDHGYRFAYENNSLYGTKFQDMNLEYKYMTNILNAVYYMDEKMDIEGLSGINTLITVMNRLLNIGFKLK